MDNAIGCIAPAPTPCTNRQQINAIMDPANPASSDPARNIAIPTSITGLRPYTSARLPKTTVMAVCASRNDENTQL